ncbi:MAG: MotA/TolQ/ExbB proton channel family protein [Verrucomicrobiales bacterium]|nr:MotA/TolQ/ExbB proton channel family protein [Verrucomicrobiales bacterium]
MRILQSLQPRLRNRRLLASLATGALLLTAALPASAQQDAEPPAAPKSGLQKYVLDGGIWMLPLGICSVATIGLTVLCLMTLGKKKFTPPDLKAEMMDLMQQCRVRSAIEVASQSPSFLGRMMTIALPHFDATDEDNLGVDKVEDAMADFATVEIKPYQKWVGYFGLLAQVSPMLGLMGTVIGMVGAFAVLSSTGGAEPAKLAGDISVALLTTLGGLIVAIPSLALFFFFKNRLNDLVSESVLSGMELTNAASDAVHGEARAARIPEGLAI